MNENLRQKLDIAIANYQNGELQKYLDNYRLGNGRKLVWTSGYNRTVMLAIIKYLYHENAEICQLLQNLESYCQKRNDYIHQLKGISKLESEEIIPNMKQILKTLSINIQSNPFNEINQKINDLLSAQ